MRSRRQCLHITLGTSLSLCYYIGFLKLVILRSNVVNLVSSTVGGQRRSKNVKSLADAVKMAHMYAMIGGNENTLKLIDETLDGWKKGNKGGILGNQDATKNIGFRFTINDVKNIEEAELNMVIQRLVITADTLIKLHGSNGYAMSTEINISAAKKLKDLSIIFPI